MKTLKTRMETCYGRKYDFSNYTFRRTFGRRMWMLKVDIAIISKMLGHESIIQTMEYLGLNQEDQIDPMKEYNAFIEKAVVQFAR